MEALKGKVVLLTGGSRGLGPVIAESLAKRGAIIALTARSKTGLDTVASNLGAKGTEIISFPADLSQPPQREKLIKDVLNEFGKIDILINNAGLETEGAYTELAWASIQETIEVNLTAPMELTHLVLPGMLKRKSGHIVNISSIAAKSGGPYAATYSGTKAGMAEWTRGLRLELRNSGIHFSSIFPGYVREVGMFARFGMTPPRMVGSCHPSKVAEAVVRAILKKRKEVIINSQPLRYVFMLNEFSPSMGDWLMRVSGASDFQRKKVGK
jgi:short-subunit dehydrogenase